MVEVFKTNVIDTGDAQKIIDQIHDHFSDYQANFALDDCDKILRIKCLDGFVAPTEIIAIVSAHGFEAAILPEFIFSVQTYEVSMGKNTENFVSDTSEKDY